MKLLAFDTSSTYASFALLENQRCVVELQGEFGSRHSQRVISEVEHLLQLAGWHKTELDALVVGIGPGSFTGLRVGLATAQGLSFALQRPLYGVSSLDAMAQAAPAGPSLLVACVDARKQELYVRWYRRHLPSDSQPPEHTEGKMGSVVQLPAPEPLSAHLLLTPATLAEAINERGEDALFVGNGTDLYQAHLQEAVRYRIYRPVTTDFDRVSASHLARLAMPAIESSTLSPAHQIQPIYIRPSDAEINVGPPTGGPPLRGRMAPDGSVLPVAPQEVPPKEE